MAKPVKISQIVEGPIRHPVLPAGVVERIKAFKAALGDVETVSVEETIDSFTRDAHPEKELLIWERIASTFTTYLAHNPTDDSTIRKEVYTVIFATSLGDTTQYRKNIKHLSQDQINHIVLNYTGI